MTSDPLSLIGHTHPKQGATLLGIDLLNTLGIILFELLLCKGREVFVVDWICWDLFFFLAKEHRDVELLIEHILDQALESHYFVVEVLDGL